jgi:Flp pilus assembly protein TadG
MGSSQNNETTTAHPIKGPGVAALKGSGWRKPASSGNRRGNSLIEMSLVLPVLLWLAMGMGEFGQYFYIKSTFQAAARDVARASILATAVQADPAATATRTLGYANVTFNSSWMTITDVTSTPATTVTDVSQVAPGHALQVTIQVTYNLIPNVYRPLNQITGQGIQNGKVMTGQCTMIKE